MFSRIIVAVRFLAFAVGALWLSPGATAAPSVTINNPTAGTLYTRNASISYSGTFSWAVGDNSIDLMGCYSVMGGAGDPSVGSIIQSNYANIANKVNNPGGGGSGTFSSANVTPALTAPNAAGAAFFVTARPENAVAGFFGNPAYFKTVSVTT